MLWKVNWLFPFFLPSSFPFLRSIFCWFGFTCDVQEELSIFLTVFVLFYLQFFLWSVILWNGNWFFSFLFLFLCSFLFCFFLFFLLYLLSFVFFFPPNCDIMEGSLIFFLCFSSTFCSFNYLFYFYFIYIFFSLSGVNIQVV